MRTCVNCGGSIVLDQPGYHGPEWSHFETGEVGCWGSPPPGFANDVAEPEEVDA